MSGRTTEGFRKDPVWPTTMVLDLGTDDILEATGATSWKSVSSTTDRTPTASHELLNAFPAKGVVDVSTFIKNVRLLPGVWEFTFNWLLKETGGVATSIGLALSDYDDVELWSYDTQASSNISANGVAGGTFSGAIALDGSTNSNTDYVRVAMRVCSRDAGATLETRFLQMVWTRVGDTNT